MDNRRAVVVLVTLTFALSVATLLVAAATRSTNPTVWIRGTVGAVIAAVLVALALRARQGSAGARRRMLAMCAVAPVAVAALLAWPGLGLPVWMKAEQGVVGALLLAVAVLLVRRAPVGVGGPAR